MGKALPPLKRHCKATGTTSPAKRQSSKIATFAISKPRRGQEPRGGVWKTSFAAKSEATPFKKKGFPSPPEAPTKTTTRAVSTRPTTKALWASQHKSATSKLFASKAPTAIAGHWSPQMHGRRAAAATMAPPVCYRTDKTLFDLSLLQHVAN